MDIHLVTLFTDTGFRTQVGCRDLRHGHDWLAEVGALLYSTMAGGMA